MKPEREKLLRAQQSQEAWLKVALRKEVGNVKLLEQQQRLQVEIEARKEERQRRAQLHAKGTNDQKKKILHLREETAKNRAALKALMVEEEHAVANGKSLAKSHKDELIQLERKRIWDERVASQTQAHNIYCSMKSEVTRQKVTSSFDPQLVHERANALMERAFRPSISDDW